MEYPGIIVFCPTRWTVRAESVASISENYEASQSWEVARDAARDTEARAGIPGVAVQTEIFFHFFFGIELYRKLQSMVDNLSQSLQAEKILACKGEELVNLIHPSGN